MEHSKKNDPLKILRHEQKQLLPAFKSKHCWKGDIYIYIYIDCIYFIGTFAENTERQRLIQNPNPISLVFLNDTP